MYNKTPMRAFSNTCLDAKPMAIPETPPTVTNAPKFNPMALKQKIAVTTQVIISVTLSAPFTLAKVAGAAPLFSNLLHALEKNFFSHENVAATRPLKIHKYVIACTA